MLHAVKPLQETWLRCHAEEDNVILILIIGIRFRLQVAMNK